MSNYKEWVKIVKIDIVFDLVKYVLVFILPPLVISSLVYIRFNKYRWLSILFVLFYIVLDISRSGKYHEYLYTCLYLVYPIAIIFSIIFSIFLPKIVAVFKKK